MFPRRRSHGEKCFSEKKRKEREEERERERVAFCLAKRNWFDKVERDKLHCLSDIGVAFERLERDDKSWRRKYGNLANLRIYSNLHVMQSCLWKEELREGGGGVNWLNFYELF